MVDETAKNNFETATDGVQAYHNYFGTPTHDDRIWFELLTVGVFQVGLSWKVAASKIPVLRQQMAGMVIDRVAQFDEMDVERLQKEPDMIRNTRKIRATIQNARAIQAIQTEYGSFSAYLWVFVDGQPQLLGSQMAGVSDKSAPISTQLAKQLKKHQFKFVGPVVTHLFMLAGGLIQIIDED
ncbi:DNA-3-methyladenine glycosylase I [Latilactobacillus curvatus]|uniref:DNA-3-methyladenine glycosylase I n=1 Tax=Latilactobacillus curvatus TaxID=28038 RepID=UPI0039B01291